MIHYCTLFNSLYLAKGVTLYRSLAATGADFRLDILDMDGRVGAALAGLDPGRVTVIPLEEFEDPALLAVKAGRTPVEYCWTCTSSLLSHCLGRRNPDACVYVDADLMFFEDPKVLVEEMMLAGKEVLITEHRYSNRSPKMLRNGKYCVQFMAFLNRPGARKVLEDWRQDCLEWCFDRVEDGKFGDQKYLDRWVERYGCVHELRHHGGGVAPWNVQRYRIVERDGALRGIHRDGSGEFPLVFYHFHGLRFLEGGMADLGEYRLSREVVDRVYAPYVKALVEEARRLPGLNALGVRPSDRSAGWMWRRFKRVLKGTNNLVKLKRTGH